MKAQPMRREGNSYTPCDNNDVTHLRFKYKNEEGERMLPVQLSGTRKNTGNWSWNGDTEKPTIMPSIATDFGNGLKCHVWLNSGVIRHLTDCTCGLSGEFQDLETLDD